MPYIPQEDREKFHDKHSRITMYSRDHVITVGELNYLISTLVSDYIENYGLDYNAINDCIGVLECAKLELYRRIASGYEDRKLRKNGDVYL